MTGLPISFEAWLQEFPNQDLANELRRFVNDGQVANPESFIYNCIVGYQKAQMKFNANPINAREVKLVSIPVFGSLIDKSIGMKSQKISYTLQFEQGFELVAEGVGGWTEIKV